MPQTPSGPPPILRQETPAEEKADFEIAQWLAVAKASGSMMVAVWHILPNHEVIAHVQQRRFPTGLMNDTVLKYQEALAGLVKK